MTIQGLINKIFKANQTPNNTVSWSGVNGLKTIQEDIVDTIRQRTFFTVPTTADLVNQGFNNAVLCYVQDHAFFRWEANGVPNGTTIFPANDGGVWKQETIGDTDGTVTNVSALTINSLGTDLTSTVANPTTTPVITLSVPTASDVNRGVLSPSDWTTFNSKQNAITLTTTGTSGAATLVGATLNIPQYQGVLANPVTGTGSAGQVAYWSGTTTQTGSNNLFWDNTNGRLGIGTNAPANPLQITYDSTSVSGLNLNTTVGTSGIFNNISFTTSGILRGAFGINNQSGEFRWNSTSGGYFPTIYSNGSEAMRIPTTGNVLIGTTTDAGYKLDVNGTGRVQTSITIGGASDGTLYFPNTTSGHQMRIYTQYASNAMVIFANGFNLNLNGSGGMTSNFCTTITGSNGSAALTVQQGNVAWSPVLVVNAIGSTGTRFNTNGNVLIGTTTDSGYKLDVNGTGRVQSTLTVLSSITWGSTGGGRLTFAGNDAYVDAALSTGSLIFRTNGSTTAMQIFSTQNIGIGTTTDAGYKLDVNGTARLGSGANNIIFNTSATANFIQQSYSASYYIYSFVANNSYPIVASRETYCFQSGGVSKGFRFESSTGNATLFINTVSGASSDQYVNIGGNRNSQNNPSAILELESTVKGFLPPRMTDAQILAIASPANGLMVYSTTQNVIAFYDGTGWHKVTHTNL